MEDCMKCWSDEILNKVQIHPVIVFDKDINGNYKRIAVVESISEDGTIICIESNKKMKF